MAIPTVNLKIERVADDQTATKIPTINEGVAEVDATLAGMLTLSVAGAVNVTLTRIQSLNRVFKFTGAITANISVLFPVALGCPRDFLVWNATTGAFTLTVKTTVGGSTGIAVGQDAKAHLFHDNTNVEYFAPEV